jgi:methyl-accepting chemotaxis protein
MEEQGIGSRHILETISQLNTITDQVKKTSFDMAAESEEAIKQSHTLKRIMGEVAGKMDDMSESAEQITSAVTRVKEISHDNNKFINDLSREIGKFKVD